MTDIFLSEPELRRREQKKLAQDYLLQELPGFKNYVEFVQDPFGVRIHVKSAIPFSAHMEQEMIPLATDPRGEVLKYKVDELIEFTRNEAIRMLGLDFQIEKRVEEGTRKAIERQKNEIENAAYQRGLDAGVRLALAAQKDADEAMTKIKGGS